jgi:hypothetical protein
MAESYAAALKGILNNLQGNCRSASVESLNTCKRAIEEQLIIAEVATSTDLKVQESNKNELRKVNECFDNCRFSGRTMVRECNTTCSNSLIQSLWRRVNLQEYEKIAAKYA